MFDGLEFSPTYARGDLPFGNTGKKLRDVKITELGPHVFDAAEVLRIGFEMIMENQESVGLDGPADPDERKLEKRQAAEENRDAKRKRESNAQERMAAHIKETQSDPRQERFYMRNPEKRPE